MIESGKKAQERKLKAFFKNLRELYPDVMSLVDRLDTETKQAWESVGTYVGEEKLAGISGLSLTEKGRLWGTPLDWTLIVVTFKIILDKIEEELKWFKENREMLEVLIKDYEERERFR